MSEIVLHYINLLIKYLDELRTNDHVRFIKYSHEYIYPSELTINYIVMIETNHFQSSITINYHNSDYIFNPNLIIDLTTLLKSLHVVVTGFELIDIEDYFTLNFSFKEIPKLPAEMLMEIGLKIDDAKTWKSYITSGKEIYKAVKPIKKKKVAELSNHLWTLIKLFPNMAWNWERILSNVNTTWDNIVNDFPLKEYLSNPALDLILHRKFWISISKNPNITLDNIMTRPQGPWYYLMLSKNTNIPLWYIKQNLHLNWGWNEISQRSDVTWDIVINNPTIPWNIKALSCNKNITLDIIIQNSQLAWDQRVVQTKADLTWDYVIKHPNYPWKYNSISGIAPIDFVFQHLDFNWNWYVISSKITLETFLKYPNFSWNMVGLSGNKNIPFDIVKQYYQLEWGFYDLSFRIPIEIILNNLNYPWHWGRISQHAPLEVIEKNPQLPWSYFWLSSNPNLTWKFVSK